jgi:hypothetical protein
MRTKHQVALAGPKVDIFVQAVGPLTHIPQAGIWLALSVLTWHSKSGDWGLHLSSDSMGYHSNKSWNFAQAVMVTAVWVCSSHINASPYLSKHNIHVSSVACQPRQLTDNDLGDGCARRLFASVLPNGSSDRVSVCR